MKVSLFAAALLWVGVAIGQSPDKQNGAPPPGGPGHRGPPPGTPPSS